MGSKIVEFIGPPGCGKSTLTELLSKSLSEDGLKVYNLSFEIGKKKKLFRILFKSRFFIPYFIKHPLLCVNHFTYIKNSNQSTFKDTVKTYSNLLYILGVYDSLNNNSKYDYIIFDQGLIQAVWSILISSNNINFFPPPQLPIDKISYVFRIVVSKNKLINRLNKRRGNQSRIENLPPKEILKQIVNYETYFDKLIEIIKINPVKIKDENFKHIHQNISIIKNAINLP